MNYSVEQDGRGIIFQFRVAPTQPPSILDIMGRHDSRYVNYATSCPDSCTNVEKHRRNFRGRAPEAITRRSLEFRVNFEKKIPKAKYFATTKDCFYTEGESRSYKKLETVSVTVGLLYFIEADIRRIVQPLQKNTFDFDLPEESGRHSILLTQKRYKKDCTQWRSHLKRSISCSRQIASFRTTIIRSSKSSITPIRVTRGDKTELVLSPLKKLP